MEVQANRAAPGIHSFLGLSLSGLLLLGSRRRTFSGLASKHSPIYQDADSCIGTAGLWLFLSCQWGSPVKLPGNGNNRILQQYRLAGLSLCSLEDRISFTELRESPYCLQAREDLQRGGSTSAWASPGARPEG